jgi:hypothetical protein
MEENTVIQIDDYQIHRELGKVSEGIFYLGSKEEDFFAIKVFYSTVDLEC